MGAAATTGSSAFSTARSSNVLVSDMASYPHVLAVERLDVERLGLLRLVRMAGAGIHLEVAHQLALQRAALEHALDRLLADALRVLAVENLARRALFDSAGVAGVPLIKLVLGLVTREDRLLRIDHNYVIAGIDM